MRSTNGGEIRIASTAGSIMHQSEIARDRSGMNYQSTKIDVMHRRNEGTARISSSAPFCVSDPSAKSLAVRELLQNDHRLRPDRGIGETGD